MTTFKTTVAGIPCQCHVTMYSEGLPMRITGTGLGDADPPEPPDFEFDIYDRRGRHAPWLERKLTDDDDERLYHEFMKMEEVV